MKPPARAIGVAIAVVVAIYVLRLDRVAGLMVDDAWYIVLAQSLARGDGYRLISSATAEILPAVPPGFPALLAPIIAVAPAFPANVVWLKLISLAAVFAMAVVCWVDFTRHRGLPANQATLLTTVTVLTPGLVFLATSTVMSDCVFALAQVITVCVVERIVRREETDGRAPVVAGLAAGVTILIRTAGVAVVIAGIIYLLISSRRRQAVAFAVVAGAVVLPWSLYARAHEPTDSERMAHGGTIAYSYQQLLTMDRLNDPAHGASSIGALARRGSRNLAGVVTRDVGAVLVPSFYRGPFESGQEVISIGGPAGGSMGGAPQTMVISMVLTGIVIAGAIFVTRPQLSMPALLLVSTLLMIAPVGGQTFRYAIPLAPYLVWFFWNGLRHPVAARIGMATLLGLLLMDHGAHIQRKLTATTEWLEDARENDELFAWMASNLRGDGAIAATNPGLAYLWTGRRTVASVSPKENWERWQQAGIRYVAASIKIDLPPESLNWTLLYRTRERGLWVIEIDKLPPRQD